MAKQIKVIKCPQCGNTKPSSIKNEHYRCDKCDTEFFLDNDDINVNVNHKYEHTHQPQHNTTTGNTSKIFISIVAFFILFFLTSFLIRLCTPSKKHGITKEMVSENPKNRPIIQLLAIEGKPITFYLETRDPLVSLKNNDNKGVFAVFYDITQGKIIKEEKVIDDTRCKIEYRYFTSEKAAYFILNDQSIYKISPNEYNFKNITPEIAAAKPALNSGFSSVYFVPAKNGDGFRLTTHLGKEFYYFPHPDQLYTERAFKYTAEGGIETLSPEAKDFSYYLFLNKESKQSSNVAQLLQISYKYNNGGPENKMSEATEHNLKQTAKYRITSVKPVTEERICFSPQVLYYDKDHILISYRTTLANDASTNVQLLSSQGEILWTVPFNDFYECKSAIKTDKGFVLQTGNNQFYEINNKGINSNTYSL